MAFTYVLGRTLYIIFVIIITQYNTKRKYANLRKVNCLCLNKYARLIMFLQKSKRQHFYTQNRKTMNLNYMYKYTHIYRYIYTNMDDAERGHHELVITQSSFIFMKRL